MTSEEAEAVRPPVAVPTAAPARSPVVAARVRRVARSVTLWPALLTFVTTSWRAGRPMMWQDEMVSWDVATRPVPRILALLRHVDAVHGCYYLFLHYWIAVFGDSLYAMRLPGILAMSAAAAFTAAGARELVGPRGGLLAGLVFAVLPSVTWYAQTVRSYALVTGCCAAATWALLRALGRPSWQRWLPYTGSMALAGLLNLIAAALITGHAVVALAWAVRTRRPRLFGGFLLAAAVAVVCMLPVVALGRSQAGTQVRWVPHPTATAVAQMWPQLTASHLTAWVLPFLLVLPLLQRRHRRAAWTFLAAFLVPVLTVLALSAESRTSYWLARYLVFGLPALAMLAGTALAAVRPRPLGAALLAAVAVLGIPAQHFVRQSASHDWFSYPEPTPYHLSEHTADFRTAAHLIRAGYRPGDATVYTHEPAWRSVNLGVRYFLPPGLRPLPDVLVARPAAQLDTLWDRSCPAPAACLTRAHAPRLWIVTLGQSLPGLPRTQQTALAHHYGVDSVRAIDGLTVTLMTRTPPHPGTHLRSATGTSDNRRHV